MHDQTIIPAIPSVALPLPLYTALTRLRNLLQNTFNTPLVSFHRVKKSMAVYTVFVLMNASVDARVAKDPRFWSLVASLPAVASLSQKLMEALMAGLERLGQWSSKLYSSMVALLSLSVLAVYGYRTYAQNLMEFCSNMDWSELDSLMQKANFEANVFSLLALISGMGLGFWKKTIARQTVLTNTLLYSALFYLIIAPLQSIFGYQNMGVWSGTLALMFGLVQSYASMVGMQSMTVGLQAMLMMHANFGEILDRDYDENLVLRIHTGALMLTTVSAVYGWQHRQGLAQLAHSGWQCLTAPERAQSTSSIMARDTDRYTLSQLGGQALSLLQHPTTLVFGASVLQPQLFFCHSNLPLWFFGLMLRALVAVDQLQQDQVNRSEESLVESPEASLALTVRDMGGQADSELIASNSLYTTHTHDRNAGVLFGGEPRLNSHSTEYYQYLASSCGLFATRSQVAKAQFSQLLS